MSDDSLVHAACDLCGCDEHKVLFRKKDTTSYWLAKCAEDKSLDPATEFPIVECARCRHVYVTPRLSPEVNADIYARFWQSYEPQGLREDEFAVYLCRQLAKLTHFGKLLDFGCGWGHYVQAAQTVGWDAVGFEVDPKKIQFARDHGLNAVHGELLDRVFKPETFDAVIAQQVFEHLYNPVSYLKEIQRILKPGGVLFVSVPNYGSVVARMEGPNWEMVSPVAHVRYFTGRGLKRFLSEHGFVVVPKCYLRRFKSNLLKNLLYQGLTAVENVFDIYPHALSLYARKISPI
jgi:2-polyprenyl-3-methyl-5-hydroxy-6-metoxy-1,4-benzoquinol methylase